MTPDEWMKDAAALAAQHDEYSEADVATCRRALLAVFGLFKTAPAAVQEAYSRATERDLADGARDRSDAITAGDFSWLVPAGSDVRAWTLAAGAQARALDDVLITSAPSHQGPVDPETWLCPEFAAYAIPRPRFREKASKREGQRFSRRGILRHRVIPSVVEAGFKVELIRHDTTASPPGEAVVMGAALFPGLVLQTEKLRESEFLAIGIKCADQPAMVLRQIEAGYADGCFAIMWPELTVTPDLLNLISQNLGDRVLTSDPRSSLQLVVAGSWHVKERDIYSNLATVLDGYGSETLQYRKVMPYRDGNVGTEGIGIPATIPILVTDDHLIGFGICKDFCDLSVTLAYKDLDIDLVMVPSMGNAATMDGHRNTAKSMRTFFGTRAFVVQQADPDSPVAEQPGWVLPFPDDPSRGGTADLHQAGEWASYAGVIPRGEDSTKK